MLFCKSSDELVVFFFSSPHSSKQCPYCPLGFHFCPFSIVLRVSTRDLKVQETAVEKKCISVVIPQTVFPSLCPRLFRLHFQIIYWQSLGCEPILLSFFVTIC